MKRKSAFHAFLLAGAVMTLALTGCTSTGDQDTIGSSSPTTTIGSHETSITSTTLPTPEISKSDTTPGARPSPTSPGSTESTENPDTGSATGDLNPPASLSRDDANVDARDYQQGDTFYFQSPTGDYTCAIRPLDSRFTGCAGPLNPVPTQLSNCPTTNSASITIGGYLCQTQGIMTGQEGGAVLPYGSVLVVQNVICTSQPSGIACDTGGHGFTISPQHNSVY